MRNSRVWPSSTTPTALTVRPVTRRHAGSETSPAVRRHQLVQPRGIPIRTRVAAYDTLPRVVRLPRTWHGLGGPVPGPIPCRTGHTDHGYRRMARDGKRSTHRTRRNIGLAGPSPAIRDRRSAIQRATSTRLDLLRRHRKHRDAWRSQHGQRSRHGRRPGRPQSRHVTAVPDLDANNGAIISSVQWVNACTDNHKSITILKTIVRSPATGSAIGTILN